VWTGHVVEETCSCDKSVKVPVKKKPSNEVKTYVFNCRFNATDAKEAKAKQALLTQSDKIYGYGIDFTEPFSCYLCGTCNNNLVQLIRDERQQATRLAAQLEQATQHSNESPQEEKEQPQEQTEKHSSGDMETVGRKLKYTRSGGCIPIDRIKDKHKESKRNKHEEEEMLETVRWNRKATSKVELIIVITFQPSDVSDEHTITFKCSIKQGRAKPNAATWVTVANPTYEKFVKKIQQIICEELNLHEVHQEDYSVEYKVNQTGIGTMLKQHTDFARFLAEHVRLKTRKKEMLVLVMVKDIKNQKQKRQYAGDSYVSNQHNALCLAY